MRYFKSNTWGLLAGTVFASTLALVLNHAGRTGDYDIFLTLFTTAYVLCFFNYCQSLQHKWLRWFWLFLTLAVLIKGVAGFFFLPGLALFALLQKHFKTLLRNKWNYAGFLFLIVIVGSYYALREWHAPGFLQAVYNNELGGRYLQELEENGQPTFFYFDNFSWRYPYWLYFIIPAFVLGWFSSSKKVKQFSLFLFLLSTTYLFIISSSKTKLMWYDIPLYPLFAMQVGWLLYAGWQWLQKRALYKTGFVVKPALAVSLVVLLFAFPYSQVYRHITNLDKHTNEYKQAYFLKKALQQKKDLGQYTFVYEDYDRHILYYAKRLQHQNVNVRVRNDVSKLQPGRYVVVSEDSTRKKLLQPYEVRPQDEKHHCQVYYIKARLKEQTNNLATGNTNNAKKESW